MTDLPPDAELRIARYCWPEVDGEIGIGLRAHNPAYWPHDWIQQAELVLIERGLAHQYGKALQATFTERARTKEEAVAWIATAPLDARVRAMLAVIEHAGGKPPSASQSES